MQNHDQAPDIELAVDPRFQAREWMVQRVGWVVMLLLVLGGAAGAFGRGPLARAVTAADDGMLRLEYERVIRHRSPIALELQAAPGAGSEGKVRLWVSRDYLQEMELSSVLPEPEAVEAAGGGYVFTIGIADARERASIRLDLTPQHYGTVRGRIGLVGQKPLRFEQFVLP